MARVTFGVIVGNRGFFPDALAKEGRRDILKVLKDSGYDSVALSMTETKFGAVETFEDAKKCAALFASKADKIDGIIVTLPNFGDERGVAEAVKRSGLNVPILIQAEEDAAGQMAVLEATLQALENIQAPGGIVHLPFEWLEAPKEVRNSPPEDPPIARYLARHPWFLPRLLNRNVPE